MYDWDKRVALDTLVGKVILDIKSLEEESEEVWFFTDDGNQYKFYHDTDCCETVTLNDFDGCAEDLIGATILTAEEVDGEWEDLEGCESYTWTFYKIETTKGGIWMRWLGQSNGYYSEAVDFIWVNKPESKPKARKSRSMEELQKMGKECGLEHLAEHEQAGTLADYIGGIAPKYVTGGEVLKFSLLDELGWL